MNVRPPRPKRGALPSCATSRKHMPCPLMVAHLRCFLSQTILNRLLGRDKLRHIPKTFAPSVDGSAPAAQFLYGTEILRISLCLPLPQTILNRLCQSSCHIPKTFALSVEWQRTYGAFSRKFFRKSGAQVLNGIDIPFSASSSVFKELTLKSLSKYLKFNNNKSNRQDSF